MDVKQDLIRLKEQWVHSKGSDRRQADEAMQAFFDGLKEEDKTRLQEAVSEDLEHVHDLAERATELQKDIEVRKVLGDTLPFISVSEFSKVYFGKSAAWLHQRINGNMVHGKPARFTPSEMETLAHALNDVAGRLQRAAAGFH